MVQRYVCRGCNKGCKRGETHKCGETCGDWKSIPPLCTPKKESRASPPTETLEVARVSKNIRQTSCKARPSAKRCEIAPCVTRARRKRITKVSNHSASIVDRKWR